MILFRRLSSGLVRISLCLALAILALAGQTATSRIAQAQVTDIRAIVLSGTGTGTYKPGQAITITADAPPAGFQFSKWLVYGGTPADGTRPTTTVTPAPGARLVVAVPQRVLIPPAPGANQLTVLRGTGGGSYLPGKVVEITAPPTYGAYSFAYWGDPLKIVANPQSLTTTVTMPNKQAMVYAVYLPSVTPLTSTAVTVVGGTGSGSYKAGTTASISATIPAGMAFDRWTSSQPVTFANPLAAQTTFRVPATAVTVTATFKAIVTVDVTITGGTINGGAATGKFVEGTRLNIRANAAPAGQVFDKWTGMTAGLASVTAEQTVLTVGSTAVVVASSYKPAPVAQVRVTVVSGVVVNPSPTGTYAAGSKITVRANPAAAGRDFDRWTSTSGAFASPASTETEYTVPATAATLTATYKTVTASTAVLLTSHKNGDPVATGGETVFGTVRLPANVASLVATIATTGRTETLAVAATTGAFALRLFAEDIPLGQPVGLSFERTDVSGTKETATFTLNGSNKAASLQMVAGRLSFGATPALMNQIKTTGFNAWVTQQLSPTSISDTGLAALNPDSLLRATDEPYQLQESIPWWMMAHSAYSQRQLLEVMTLFWNNHFWSVDTGDDIHMSDVDELRGFRTNAFGKFRELLRVSTKNAQMMKYLDNVDSRRGRLNENYARELLELHTVGVDGGYGNDDIIAVARVFTGWSREVTTADGVKPKLARFLFRSGDHDTADKVIPFLNMTITGRTGAAGEQEGEELIDVLARHPKTREFVCGKIVELLVSDARPASFVDLCTAEWQRTDGNIGSILRVILLSPDYLTSVENQRSKAKTPYEYIVSFVRNFGIYPVAGKERDFFNGLRGVARDAGMDLVNFGVPTGFKETGRAWTSTASFIQKYRGATGHVTNFASSTNTNRRANVDYVKLLSDANMRTAQAAAAYLLALTTSDRFRKDEYDSVVAILNQTRPFDLAATDAAAKLRKAVGLIVTLPSVQLQ